VLKKLSLILVLVMIFSIMSSCSLAQKSKNNSEHGQDSESIDPIKDQVSKMSLEEKIGQMLILGIEGYSLDENSRNLVRKYKVGGFIFFSTNVRDTNQLLNLINSVKKENANNKIPLFLSVDEEGGRITRMPKSFNRLPTNEAIGEINNPVFSNKIGRTIGNYIGSFGFNMNFAPVLDVNSNPQNPVIGDRSYSSDPHIVSNLGVETMKGIKSAGVIPVVKHFPGHGDTSVDSHLGLPVVKNDLQRLRNLEFIPFSEAIKNDAEVVMIAHILLPKIDKENPSSMSKTIITDILRDKLNFKGVVITDDMTMGAIMKNYNIGEAAVKSVNAGSDVVLVCHGYNNEVEVINALESAVLNGNISKQRIDESVYRILSLKKKYDLKDDIKGNINISQINSEIDALLDVYVNKQ
jgi:beta-N-acetylhexosaminidase